MTILVSVLLGMLGFLLGWVLFYAGYRAGRELREEPVAAPAPREKTPEEADQMERERERILEEQNAFHNLMGYNADVAYGRRAMPKE